MPNPAGRRARIRHLHAFRGVAIIAIVAVHAGSLAIYDIGGGTEDNVARAWLATLNEVLLHDSTLFFALISGLLFSVVLKAKGWTAFFRSKALNVIAPYGVMTALFTLFHWHWSQDFQVFSDGPVAFVETAGRNLLHGTAMGPFWYIPVLAVLFVLTPLISLCLDHRVRRWLIWPIVLAPLLISRTGAELSVPTAIYFLGAYAGGMALGLDYERLSARLSARWLWLLALSIVTSLGLIGLISAELDRLGPVSLRESLFYLQKLALAALILVWLRTHETAIPRWLDPLASSAFAIYFLHQFVLYTLGHLTRLVIVPPQSALVVGVLIVAYLVATLVICLALTLAVKRLLGPRARWLIGA